MLGNLFVGVNAAQSRTQMNNFKGDSLNFLIFFFFFSPSDFRYNWYIRYIVSRLNIVLS